MYLDVADSTSLPYGWSRFAQFSLAVVNQIHPKLTVRKGNFFAGLAFSFMYLLLCILLLMYQSLMPRDLFKYILLIISPTFVTGINHNIKILTAKRQYVRLLLYDRVVMSEIYKILN